MKRHTALSAFPWRSLGASVLAWIGAATLFSLVRLWGTEEEELYQRVALQVNVWEVILFQGVVVGTAFGLAFGTLDLWLDRRDLRKWRYGYIMLLRTLAHIFITLVIFFVSTILTHFYVAGAYKLSLGQILYENLLTRTAAVILIYTSVMSALFSLIRQTNAMFGPGVLLNLLAGKYHQPQEEERIFMFLDLRSSTTYAERLGHVLYSELIQDCFYDLTEAVKKHQVEIYQYVGDEAVLTWRVPEGLRNSNCIRAFFSFDRSIQARAGYYFNKYDLVPAFKAGVNIGLVMVAEVGVVKKEIAYHSDVLNTAARIQGRCNELGHELLISSSLKSRLTNTDGLTIERVGEVSLKGKQEQVTIYCVEETYEREHRFEFAE
jgi:adenylate cyclase